MLEQSAERSFGLISQTAWEHQKLRWAQTSQAFLRKTLFDAACNWKHVLASWALCLLPYPNGTIWARGRLAAQDIAPAEPGVEWLMMSACAQRDVQQHTSVVFNCIAEAFGRSALPNGTSELGKKKFGLASQSEWRERLRVAQKRNPFFRKLWFDESCNWTSIVEAGAFCVFPSASGTILAPSYPSAGSQSLAQYSVPVGQVILSACAGRGIQQQTAAALLDCISSAVERWMYSNRAVDRVSGTGVDLLANESSEKQELHLAQVSNSILRTTIFDAACNWRSIMASGAFCFFPHRNGTLLAPGYPMAQDQVRPDTGVVEVMLLACLKDGQSVLDVGCGIGQYGHYLREHAPSIKWEGYDGGVNVEIFTNGFVKWADLGLPLYPSQQQYDWVICLEVGEHMHASSEMQLLENIAVHAICGAIVSWALPGQGGHGHINEQPNWYVIEKLESFGLLFDNASSSLRSRAKYWYFRDTLMIFRRKYAPWHCAKRFQWQLD